MSHIEMTTRLHPQRNRRVCGCLQLVNGIVYDLPRCPRRSDADARLYQLCLFGVIPRKDSVSRLREPGVPHLHRRWDAYSIDGVDSPPSRRIQYCGPFTPRGTFCWHGGNSPGRHRTDLLRWEGTALPGHSVLAELSETARQAQGKSFWCATFCPA